MRIQHEISKLLARMPEENITKAFRLLVAELERGERERRELGKEIRKLSRRVR